MLKKLFFITLIVAGIYYFWGTSEQTHPPGILVKNDPKQVKIDNPETFTHKDYTITPVAAFSGKARVLSKKGYSFGREAELSPFDLALGWGQMSNSLVLKDIRIRQSNRFYYWRSKTLPIPEKQIVQSSANMHFIPANKEVLTVLKNIRKGSLISFSGYLVRIKASDGWYWNTSETRNDSGDGACEVVYTKKLSILSPKAKKAHK